MPDKKIKGLISVKEAKELENLYKKEFYTAINDGKLAEYPDYEGAVRDVWFSIDELKDYISYVEKYVKSQEYESPGLRVYFGAKNQEGGNGKIYPRQTVFFVPTAQSRGDAKNEQFNILSLERLNYGNAGIPDSRDSDEGMP